MKNKIAALVISIFVMGLHLNAQECKMYFPDKEGSIREVTNYDKKGKETGKVLQEITSKKASAGKVEVTIQQTVMDKKGEKLSSNALTIFCDNGVFRFDMRNYFDESAMKAYKDMQMEMSGDNLTFPSSLNVGDQLKDASFTIVVKNSGIKIITMSISIIERKVLAKEKITTAAGSFDCSKISYSMISKTGFITIKSSAIEWLSEGVGVVKSETHAKNGDLVSHSELTKLKL